MSTRVDTSRRALWFIAAVVAGLVIFQLPASWLAPVIRFLPPHTDKLVHFLAHAVAVLCCATMPARYQRPALLLVLLHAALGEVFQAALDLGRSFDRIDLICSVLGVLVGLVLVWRRLPSVC